MKMMRDFVVDGRLRRALDALETAFGYEIACDDMPKGDQADARCMIALNQNAQWTLFQIHDEPPSQATICHELMHLVLWLEGWPAFTINSTTPSWDYRMQTLRMLKNLALHIEVWPLVIEMGFDEDYDSQIASRLIPLVENQTLHHDVPFQGILPARAAYIAQGLLCPTAQDTRDRLRATAQRTMPQALAVADSMCLAFEKRKPLSPQSCQDALCEVLEIMRVPKGILLISFSDTVYPDIRVRILA